MNKELIQRSQTKAARLVLNQNWYGPTRMNRKTALDKLDWCNVNQLADIALLNLVKRAISGQASKGMKDMFTVSTPRHPRGMNAMTLKHNGHPSMKDHNFVVNATTKFNQLPLELRNPDLNCKSFKSQLKKHIKTTMLLSQQN